ncbi:Syntaxin-16 [Trichinella zimbabwensis]|uniref:Syntaxin-16 n=1 Tax=Trichinella zimbabwensis TaxID=268475 RepID=A0A0V1HBR2_9BILA|nr:Syntaxin-16 [Trichinella zimbabwensis]
MGHFENLPRLGIVRSLTDIYITLRNNAVQSRHIFHDNVSRKSEDRMTLIPLHDSSVETSIPMSDFREPPEWIHIVDEIQFEMSKISTQISELKSLQQRHVSRPSFSDEISQEEQNIENLTGKITHQLNHVQSLLQLVTRSRSEGTAERFRANVVLAHVQALQTLTSDFQRSQSEYLRQIQSRENSYQKYFESYISSNVGDICLPDFQNADIGDLATTSTTTTTGVEPTMSELQLLEQSTVLVKEREREILHVTRSIVELNQLFRDLATYISDQGTVLDRIDYNVEKSAVKTKSALSSIKTAEKYQRRSRKIIIIITLAVLCILLIIIMAIVKSSFVIYCCTMCTRLAHFVTQCCIDSMLALPSSQQSEEHKYICFCNLRKYSRSKLSNISSVAS